MENQGRSKKQYEDSAKVSLIAIISIFTMIASLSLYNLILG